MDLQPFRQLSDYYNPAQEADKTVALGLHLYGLRRLDEAQQFKEQQVLQDQQDAQEIAKGLQANPNDPQVLSKFMSFQIRKGHGKDVIDMVQNNTGLAAVAEQAGISIPLLRGYNELKPEQFKAIAEPDLQQARLSKLNLSGQKYAAIYKDNAQYVGSYAHATDTSIDDTVQKQLAADYAVVEKFGNKKDLTPDQQARANAAAKNIDSTIEQAAKLKQQQDQQAIAEATKVRDGALAQQKFPPVGDPELANLYDQVTTLKAKAADAFIAYKQDPSPEHKDALKASSDLFDAAVNAVKDRSIETKKSIDELNMARTNEKTLKLAEEKGVLASQTELQAKADAKGMTLTDFVTKYPGVLAATAVKNQTKVSVVREAITGSKGEDTGAVTIVEKANMLVKGLAQAAGESRAADIIDPVTGQVNYARLMQHSAEDQGAYIDALTRLVKSEAFAPVRRDLQSALNDAKSKLADTRVGQAAMNDLKASLPPPDSDVVSQAVKGGGKQFRNPTTGATFDIGGGGDKPLTLTDPKTGHRFELKGKGKSQKWVAVQ